MKKIEIIAAKRFEIIKNGKILEIKLFLWNIYMSVVKENLFTSR